MKRIAWMVVALGLVQAGQARAFDLIVNGGFETGDFTGWTVVYDPNDVMGVHVDSGTYGGLPVAHSGRYAAAFGNYYLHPDSIYQDLSNVSGQTYLVDFWLENEAGPDNSFVVSWGGTTLLSLNNSAIFSYTEYQFTVSATDSTTMLEFSGTQTPGGYFLDDVSVVLAGYSVPEPASLTMFGIGAAVAMGYARRLRTQMASTVERPDVS